MEQPILSIVIPVFNRSKIVGATLASIAQQSYRPFNLILVDNASTDNTREVLADWKNSVEKSPQGKGINITITDCKKPGAAAARNVGLQLVNTPWIMYFDSDDIMSPNHIELAIKDIKNNPDADIIGWNTNIVDNKDKLLRISPFYSKNYQWHNLFNGCLSTLHYCTRTELIRQAGGWNEDVGYWDDIELGARLLLYKPNILKSQFYKDRVVINTSEDSITGKQSDNPERIKPALASIGKIIDKHNWILLKQVIEAAVCSRAGSSHGKELYKKSISQCNSKILKFKLLLAYLYTLKGGRGIALIYYKLRLLN